jgi:hypothetical protein
MNVTDFVQAETCKRSEDKDDDEETTGANDEEGNDEDLDDEDPKDESPQVP